jgi:hypothetical protein
MLTDHYVWITFSSGFLLPWLALFLLFPRQRATMIWSSVLTMPLGLTEPLFVPRYWNAPSLFDLAQRTGFDIESFIFAFGIGGVGATLYNIVLAKELMPVSARERHAGHHRFHGLALLVPVLAFPALCILRWSPIYPAIIAMALGAVATVICRPDLKWNTVTGGALFTSYYAAFILLLEWSAPGYIARVWNLSELSGITIAGIPLEELLFSLAFGGYWAGIYEHLTWSASTKRPGIISGDRQVSADKSQL